MDTSVKIYLNGVVVSHSQNLRGIVEYVRKHGVKQIQIAPLKDHRGLLFFLFENDATCLTTFVDYDVLTEWVNHRRSFCPVLVLDPLV